MPVILKNIDSNGLSTGLWKITESEEDLLKKARLSADEEALFASFRNEGRRKQWLAVRALLEEFISPRPVIKYKENGRPFFANSSNGISVSHSGNMAAIALSNTSPGIDVEEIHPKINKIAHRFVSDEEMAFLRQDLLTEQLCIIWAVKEVLYKIHPEGMLSFKENLAVAPFVLSDSMELKGSITKDGRVDRYRLMGRRIENYVLVNTTH